MQRSRSPNVPPPVWLGRLRWFTPRGTRGNHLRKKRPERSTPGGTCARNPVTDNKLRIYGRPAIRPAPLRRDAGLSLRAGPSESPRNVPMPESSAGRCPAATHECGPRATQSVLRNGWRAEAAVLRQPMPPRDRADGGRWSDRAKPVSPDRPRRPTEHIAPKRAKKISRLQEFFFSFALGASRLGRLRRDRSARRPRIDRAEGIKLERQPRSGRINRQGRGGTPCSCGCSHRSRNTRSTSRRRSRFP